MADVQALTQKIHEYTDWVVEQEQVKDPKFKYHKSLDASYRTWTAGDTWTMTEVPKNKVMDYQEVLNFGLFNTEYGQEFANRFETVIPWQLSVEQEYELAEDVAFIDESIELIKMVIARDFPKIKQGSFEYEARLAVAIWYFCLNSSEPTYEETISLQEFGNEYLHEQFDFDNFLSSVSHALNNYEFSAENEFYNHYEGLEGPTNSYKKIMRQSDRLGGLGLLEVEEDLPGEGTVYDVLKRGQGFCSEMSYAYAYIANRAGLNVGFGQASIDAPGQSNHRFNIVYCGPKKQPLKIDLAQQAIEKDYTEETPEDPYQVLASFYEQFSEAFEDYEQVFEHNFFLGHALDPTSPDILNGLASYFNKKADTEKAHELYQASSKFGNAWAFNQINAASFYENNSELGNPKEYYQKAFDIFHSYEEQAGNLSKLDVKALVCYASSAYHIGDLEKAKELFEKAIAINKYETMLESGSSDYAFCLARSGNITTGHAWFQSCLTADNEALDTFFVSYLDFIDNFLPVEKRAGARQYAYRVFTQAYHLTGQADYQLIAEKLDKTLRYVTFEKEPVIAEKNLLTAPVIKYSNLKSDIIKLNNQQEWAAIVRYYEEHKYFGSYQGLADEVYAKALYNIHVEHFNPEHYQQALPDLEKAVAVFPFFEPLIPNLAYCYVLEGNTQKLDALFDSIRGKVTDPSILYAQLANAYFETGDYESAAYYYKEALTLKPDNVVYNYNCGASLINSGNVAEGESYYKKACSLDSNYCQD
jgi:tetratricopeptide (TPR) repeat protein